MRGESPALGRGRHWIHDTGPSAEFLLRFSLLHRRGSTMLHYGPYSSGSGGRDEAPGCPTFSIRGPARPSGWTSPSFCRGCSSRTRRRSFAFARGRTRAPFLTPVTATGSATRSRAWTACCTRSGWAPCSWTPRRPCPPSSCFAWASMSCAWPGICSVGTDRESTTRSELLS